MSNPHFKPPQGGTPSPLRDTPPWQGESFLVHQGVQQAASHLPRLFLCPFVLKITWRGIRKNVCPIVCHRPAGAVIIFSVYPFPRAYARGSISRREILSPAIAVFWVPALMFNHGYSDYIHADNSKINDVRESFHQ